MHKYTLLFAATFAIAGTSLMGCAAADATVPDESTDSTSEELVGAPVVESERAGSISSDGTAATVGLPSSCHTVALWNNRVDQLSAGQWLPAGWCLHNGNYTTLVLQSDGNLVLYSGTGRALWSSRTVGSGATRLIMQSDGNLVLYRGSVAVWNTRTNTTAARQSSQMILQSDDNLVVYRTIRDFRNVVISTTAVWYTGT